MAGFVDQSESLEQAVAREVLEESGIAVEPGSARYASSQPWPFPCQLMVGFRAEVAPRTIRVGGAAGSGSGTEKARGRGNGDGRGNAFAFSYPPTPSLDIAELRDARWFHRDWLREQIGKHVDPREAKGGVTREIPVGEIALPGTHAMARDWWNWVAEPNEDRGAGASLRRRAPWRSRENRRRSGRRRTSRARLRWRNSSGRAAGATVLRPRPRGWRRADAERSRQARREPRERAKNTGRGIARGRRTLCFGGRWRGAESDDEGRRAWW